jgi:hypothetical protein
MFSRISAHPVLLVEPGVQRRGSKAPELPDMRSVNVAAPRQLLQGLVMNAQQSCSLMAIEERFEFSYAE